MAWVWRQRSLIYGENKSGRERDFEREVVLKSVLAFIGAELYLLYEKDDFRFECEDHAAASSGI